jgi:hypothetical protein
MTMITQELQMTTILQELQMPYVEQRTESILQPSHNYPWTTSMYGTAHTAMLVTQQKVAVAIAKNGGMAKGKLLTKGKKSSREKEQKKRDVLGPQKQSQQRERRKEQRTHPFGINHPHPGPVMTAATAMEEANRYVLPESEERLKVMPVIFLLPWEVHLILGGIP